MPYIKSQHDSFFSCVCLSFFLYPPKSELSSWAAFQSKSLLPISNLIWGRERVYLHSGASDSNLRTPAILPAEWQMQYGAIGCNIGTAGVCRIIIPYWYVASLLNIRVHLKRLKISVIIWMLHFITVDTVTDPDYSRCQKCVCVCVRVSACKCM